MRSSGTILAPSAPQPKQASEAGRSLRSSRAKATGARWGPRGAPLGTTMLPGARVVGVTACASNVGIASEPRSLGFPLRSLRCMSSTPARVRIAATARNTPTITAGLVVRTTGTSCDDGGGGGSGAGGMTTGATMSGSVLRSPRASGGAFHQRRRRVHDRVGRLRRGHRLHDCGRHPRGRRQGRLARAHHEDRDVVVPAARVREIDELAHRLRRGLVADDLEDLLLLDQIAEPVGAEDEGVAGDAGTRAAVAARPRPRAPCPGRA